MSLKSLQDLKSTSSIRTVPYNTGHIAIQVVKIGHTATFSNTSSEGAILNFSIADGSGAMMASFNDRSRHSNVKEGRSYHVRNFLVKGQKVVFTANTKILLTQMVKISDQTRLQAVHLVIPPSPVKTVQAVKSSPTKEICTVRGQIVKNEAIRTVNVGGTDTKIRTITLEEDGEKIDITLWRDLSEASYTVGQYLEVGHCLTAEWQKVAVLNSTRNTVIKDIEAPVVTLTGSIEGVIVGDLTVEIAVAMENDGGFKDFTIEMDILQSIITVDSDRDLEESILGLLPIPVCLDVRGSDILAVRAP